MAAWDPFSSDAFSLTSLTASINNLPYVPARLGQLGWFEESGIETTTAVIEFENGIVQLLPALPRNSPGTQIGRNGRTAQPIAIPHIPAAGEVLAEEVQNVRAFGSESAAQTVQFKINEKLAIGRRSMDYTIETHRAAALKGVYYNASGSTTSLFTEFGVAQQTLGMALTTTTTDVRGKVKTFEEYIETALGGVPYTGIRVLCGKNFFGQLIAHSAIANTYIYSQDAAALRGDPLRALVWGGVTWERYRGTIDCYIGDDDAYAVPEGVAGLFLTRYAPAPYMETVNTPGLPYYARSAMMEFNKGAKLEMQSNPLNICTRPAALVKLTKI